MPDARYILLAAMQDLMSNYLLDECPDNVTWEDFDPDIDGLRSTVIDMVEANSPSAASATFSTYLVDVDFYSGDDRYATQIYAIDASTAELAKHRALALSLDSIYSDPRIPDLARKAVARSTDQPGEPT